MSMLYLRPEVVPEYEIGNDISVYTCHVYRVPPVMSSVVHLSCLSCSTCHVERSRDISKQIPPLTSFGRNDN